MTYSPLASLGLDPETLRKAESLARMLPHAGELASQGIRPPRALLIFGGEADSVTLARALANEAGVPLQEVSGAQLLARGASAPEYFRGLLERAAADSPSALLVTGIDRIAAARGTSPYTALTLALGPLNASHLVTEILIHTDGRAHDVPHVLLIGTSVDPDVMDSAVMSHTPVKLYLPPRWDALSLTEPTLDRLRRISHRMSHARTLADHGVDVPRSLLLVGPAGPVRLQVARTLAAESDLAFTRVALSSFGEGLIGQSAQQMRRLFEAASARPTLLFLDDLELRAASRAGGDTPGFDAELVTELLTQMDAVARTSQAVFVAAAAADSTLIDELVLSRFEEWIDLLYTPRS